MTSYHSCKDSEIYTANSTATITQTFLNRLNRKQYCIICGQFVRRIFIDKDKNIKRHLERYHKNGN